MTPRRSSTRTTQTIAVPSRFAVSSSCTFIRKPPSPAKATTLRSGKSSFAAIAPGSAMPIELRRRAVDVDDDLVALRIPERRRPLDEVVADRDHEIGLRELGHVRELGARALQPDRWERERAERVNDAFRHVCVRRVQAALPNEPPEGVDGRVTGGVSSRDAVAREDHRVLRRPDELEGLAERGVLGLRVRRTADLERLRVDVLAGDVLGKLD